MAQILVASLGESSVVVTAMYELLRKREHIDAVMVLRPRGDDVRLGYDMIEEALNGKCEVEHLHSAKVSRTSFYRCLQGSYRYTSKTMIPSIFRWQVGAKTCRR